MEQWITKALRHHGSLGAAYMAHVALAILLVFALSRFIHH
jgi:hypothetical protein